jgi:cytochrome c biogenesis protein CcmG/thiol:disulfide interchange protein DsbE
MKKYLLFLLLIFPGFIPGLLAQQVYETSLSTMEGKPTDIGELKGDSLTVLDFWATWCKPCLLSIPELIKMSQEFGERGVNFIGINEDGPRNIAKVRPFAFSKGITYPVLMDADQELMSTLMVSALPTLIILDRNGKVLYTHEGFSHGDENEIKAQISDLLSDID